MEKVSDACPSGSDKIEDWCTDPMCKDVGCGEPTTFGIKVVNWMSLL